MKSLAQSNNTQAHIRDRNAPVKIVRFVQRIRTKLNVEVAAEAVMDGKMPKRC